METLSFLVARYKFPAIIAASCMLLALAAGCGGGGGGDRAPVCTANASQQCDTETGDVYWYDSCGTKGSLKEDCPDSTTCYDAVCVSNCTSNAYKGCYENNVYWYDSCNNMETLFLQCETGQTCADGACITGSCPYACCENADCTTMYPYCISAGTSSAQCVGCTEDSHCTTEGTSCVSNACVCSSQVSYSCDDGDVYWFDSCGSREDIKVDCSDEQLCSVNECITMSSCTKTFGTFYNQYTDFEDEAYDIIQSSDGGYVIVGDTRIYASMRGQDLWMLKTDSAGVQVTGWPTLPVEVSGSDMAYGVIENTAGEFIVAGSSGLGTNANMMATKLSAAGATVWKTSYGDTREQYGYSLDSMPAGGYIIGGVFLQAATGYDAAVALIDESGNLTASATFGGNGDDFARSVFATADGGYILGGGKDDDQDTNYAAWIVKADASHNQEWEYIFGSGGTHMLYSVKGASDGGYIAAGFIRATSLSNSKALLLKIDQAGTLQWSATYGGTGNDIAYSIVETAGGTFTVAGETASSGAGGADFWIFNVDSSGALVWERTFGGASQDSAKSIKITSDGGYIIAGETESYGTGLSDFWMLKLNSDGNCNASF